MMAGLKFGSKERQKIKEAKLEISKEEAALLLNLVADGNVKIRNIQSAYELVFKIQEFTNQQQ